MCYDVFLYGRKLGTIMADNEQRAIDFACSCSGWRLNPSQVEVRPCTR